MLAGGLIVVVVLVTLCWVSCLMGFCLIGFCAGSGVDGVKMGAKVEAITGDAVNLGAGLYGTNLGCAVGTDATKYFGVGGGICFLIGVGFGT